MANPNKGEVDLTLDDGSTRKLKFGTNELCALENLLGVQNLEELVALLQPEKLTITTVRAFLWAALQRYHPGTITDAGDLMDALGQVEAQSLVTATMAAGLPARKPGTAKKKKK